jgi:hypothetical protein
VGGKLTSPPSVSILHETTSLAPFTNPIACFVFLFLSTSALAQEQQFATYTDPEGRFTMDYPSDWYVNEQPSDDKESVVQFDSSEPEAAESTISDEDLTKPAVRVVISDAKPDEMSLEQLSNKKVKDLAAFTIEESERTTLSGLPAYAVKATIFDPSKNVWTLHNGKVYQILYLAHSYDYEVYSSAFQHMIESFHITK